MAPYLILIAFAISLKTLPNRSSKLSDDEKVNPQLVKLEQLSFRFERRFFWNIIILLLSLVSLFIGGLGSSSFFPYILLEQKIIDAKQLIILLGLNILLSILLITFGYFKKTFSIMGLIVLYSINLIGYIFYFDITGIVLYGLSIAYLIEALLICKNFLSCKSLKGDQFDSLLF